MYNNNFKKTHFTYMIILYLIWQMIDYYSILFQIDAGSDPAKQHVKIKNTNDVTHLIFAYPKVFNSTSEYNYLEMKEIYNEYLQTVLLSNQQFVAPYKIDSEICKITEALYVDKIYENNERIFIRILYLNNEKSYTYFLENK